MREVGFDRGGHLGILQLAGDRLAVERSLVHLPERRRRGRLQIEIGEALAPAGAEFRRHAPTHEARAHRRACDEGG